MEVFNVNFNGIFEDLNGDIENLNGNIENLNEGIEEANQNASSAMPKAGGTFTGVVKAAAPSANTFSTPQLVNAIVLAKGSSPKTDLPAGTLQFILK